VATGTYCFLGVYSGDTNYAGASDGSTTRECFTVTPATPGVTTTPANVPITVGGSDSDTATVTGTAGVTPTGSVTFYVCKGNANPCTPTTTPGRGRPGHGAGDGLGLDGHRHQPHLHADLGRRLLLPGRLLGRRQLRRGLGRIDGP
jgi:hypothetical protein